MTQNDAQNNRENVQLKGKVEITEKPKDQLEHSADARAARESTKEDKQKALELNKDRHSGSAGGQGASIELCVKDHHGNEQVAVSRQTGGTEKDIQQLEDRTKSINEAELHNLAENGDIGAAKFLERLKLAKSSNEKEAIQKEADMWFGRGESANQGQPNIDRAEKIVTGKIVAPTDHKVNTGILKAIQSDDRLPEEKRELARQLQQMRSETKKRGNCTDAIDSFAESELKKEIASQEHEPKPYNINLNELKNQILRAVIKKEIDDLKTEVGVVHGTLNFAVNTLAGIGNAVRMAGAASFQTTPIGALCPDLYPDKEATEMLHKTLETSVVAARVLTQLNTTFNPTSPLFGIEFDPQGAAMTRALAKALPEKISKELDNLAHADPEEQAAVGTEAILNIATLLVGGEAGVAGKAGELGELNSLLKVSEKTTAVADTADAARIANSMEGLNPASNAVNALAKNLEQQTNIFAALAELKPSLKPLADKFKECLTNFNEASKPEFEAAGVGKIKGDGVVDIVQNAGEKIKSKADAAGKKIEDYVNRMVRKNEGEETPDFNKPGDKGKRPGGETGDEIGKTPETPKDLEKQNALAFTDGELTENLLSAGKATVKRSSIGYHRLQRLDFEHPRAPYNWEAVGEVFSSGVIRQSKDLSCTAAIGEMLSGGRLTEAELIEKIGENASLRDLGKELGNWKFESCDVGKELEEINSKCESGSWVAKFFDRFGDRSHHVVIVDGKNSLTGRLLIRDPFEGTRYEMNIPEFLRVWNGECLVPIK